MQHLPFPLCVVSLLISSAFAGTLCPSPASQGENGASGQRPLLLREFALSLLPEEDGLVVRKEVSNQLPGLLPCSVLRPHWEFPLLVAAPTLDRIHLQESFL
jgi:hypothetical protein